MNARRKLLRACTIRSRTRSSLRFESIRRRSELGWRLVRAGPLRESDRARANVVQSVCGCIVCYSEYEEITEPSLETCATQEKGEEERVVSTSQGVRKVSEES